MIANLFANRTLILGFVAALGIAAPPPAADEVLRIAPDGTRVAPDPGGGPATPSATKNLSGELDTSFAGDGTTWSYLPGYNGGPFVEDIAEAVAVDAAGGILVAIHGEGNGGFGPARPFNVARYKADGTLDTTFGSNGIASPFGAGWLGGRVHALAIQPDDRIVVAGDGFAVARLMADGSPDATFGSGGQVLGDIAPPSPVSEIVYGMALQADGRIILAGQADGGSGATAALVRYNIDGSRDTTFGAGGVVFGPYPGIASAVAVQPDGRIVIVGGAFQVTRFNADGTLDAGFGSGGQVVVPFGEQGFDSLANAILVQPDGRIVVAGGTTLSRYDFAIARLDPDGNLDKGFGRDGMVTTDFNNGFDAIRALVLQPDGRVVAAGYGGPSNRLNEDDHFALARYEPNGALDRSFGKSGRAMAAIDDPIYDDFARALALQPDGGLVAAGNIKFFCETGGCDKSGYALARFLP
jgi:uncharacterized delta-60 repeat protein